MIDTGMIAAEIINLRLDTYFIHAPHHKVFIMTFFYEIRIQL